MPRARKPGSGGARQGQPGQTYSNRTDLNTNRAALPVMTGPSQQYGQRTQQEAAQRAIPLPNNTATPSPGQAAPAGPLPGERGGMDRATDRPMEPITAGLGMGAGAGPEVLGANFAADTAAMKLRALYETNPSDGLLALIENLED